MRKLWVALRPDKMNFAGKDSRREVLKSRRGTLTKGPSSLRASSRWDLHIQSRYSARSEEWLFRRFDFPDSYSDPNQLYGQLLKRGMDYVTITDHDTIEGCLQIAHLPRTFLSEQVTTYFSHDSCKLHILVSGIPEQQPREVECVRDDIFELQRYLKAAQITIAVAHPPYSANGT